MAFAKDVEEIRSLEADEVFHDIKECIKECQTLSMEVKCILESIGAEDKSLHVYDCSDSVRVKKNRLKVPHKDSLNCMVYFERPVFMALGNGNVAVYSRNLNGKGWLINDASWVTIGSAMNPVTNMICVQTYIWCACGSQIKVYGENGGMLELIQTIPIVTDRNQLPRGISAMITSDQQV